MLHRLSGTQIEFAPVSSHAARWRAASAVERGCQAQTATGAARGGGYRGRRDGPRTPRSRPCTGWLRPTGGPRPVGRRSPGGRLDRGRHHVHVMLTFLLLLIDVVRAAVRSRGEVVAENLLRRHQLMVLTRPCGSEIHGSADRIWR